MSHKQRTLKAPVVFRGKGLHTGLDVTMTINPADSGCGIRFRRIDLEGQPFVDALAEKFCAIREAVARAWTSPSTSMAASTRAWPAA